MFKSGRRKPEQSSSDQDIDFKFVTLGEVRLEKGIKKTNDTTFPRAILRGPGIYSALGARILAGSDGAKEIGFVARQGLNVQFLTLPHDLRNLCMKWGVHFHDDTNIYQWNAHVDVSTRPGMDEYLVQYYRRENHYPSIESFKETPLIKSPVFQLSQTPQHVKELIAAIRPLNPEAKFIWEPAPELIDKRDIPLFKQVCNDISILYIEAFSLMTLSCESPSTEITQEYIANLVSRLWLPHIHDRDGAVIVRSRSEGFWICRKNVHQDSWITWLPTYHDSPESTFNHPGAGSAFLGALAYAMSGQGKGIMDAAKSAVVAASFVVEQESFPVLRERSILRRKEKWNAETVESRVEKYQKKLDQYGL
ncbi:hypothetical protein B0T19DRAFT_479407 [Cercophora scortea]|uniref:Carbohydrate kinase PfkB domain-containing protein n=1 Tax=Cercophora scortea TaxID=314031 RepID=A0AAE0I2C0_9PEZI|nr:hypothetical protein B0T19DRAFT_479407 [Cercophora scortea]